MLDFSIDKSRNLLVISSSGEVTYEDVRSLFKRILKVPSKDTHIRCLSDFSHIKCNISQKEIRKLQRLFRIKPPNFHIRHAHVTTPEEEIKASIFFAIFGEDRDDLHTCIFQKKVLAESWLGYESDLNIEHAISDGLWN